MSGSNPVAVPSTSLAATNVWLKALNWGRVWDTPGSATTVIYYYVAGDQNVAVGNLEGLRSFDWVNADAPTAGERAAIRAAMDQYEHVANIRFIETGSIAAADLVWAFSATYASDSLGVAVPPGEFYHPGLRDYQSAVVINTSNYEGGAAGAGLVPGGYDFITLVHELGHALGMAHPHDDGGVSAIFPSAASLGYGAFGMNQGIFTTMSYNDGWTGLGANQSNLFGWQASPMALDIAWLQATYGANRTYNSGSNTYELGAGADALLAIWDAGGVDTISYTGAFASTIDLRAATLAYGPGGGGFISYVHGASAASLDHWNAFTIARGVVIENASGGDGNDRIIGNQFANAIDGGAGGDVIRSGGGNDFVIGGTGGDYMVGGLGSDVYIVDSSADRVVEAIGGGLRDWVRSSVGAVLAPNVELLSLVGTGDVIAWGNRLSNVITGNSGNNTINSAFGNDIVTGGAGSDSFRFNTPIGLGNVDTIRDFEPGVDRIEIDNAVFRGLAVGGLTDDRFRIVGEAATASDRIVYNPANGYLYYDADGSGRIAPVLFAKLSAGLALDFTDLVVI